VRLELGSVASSCFVKEERGEGAIQPTFKVEQKMADEGNVPDHPSARDILFIKVLLLAGLGLMFLVSTYGPSRVTRSEGPSSTTSAK
jgi:hypothetical protein